MSDMQPSTLPGWLVSDTLSPLALRLVWDEGQTRLGDRVPGPLEQV